MAKKTAISIRLEDEIYKEIKKLSSDTGRTITDIISESLKNKTSMYVVDGKEIAKNLFQLYTLINEERYDSDVQKLVVETCNKVTNSLYKIFEKEEM